MFCFSRFAEYRSRPPESIILLPFIGAIVSRHVGRVGDRKRARMEAANCADHVTGATCGDPVYTFVSVVLCEDLLAEYNTGFFTWKII